MKGGRTAYREAAMARIDGRSADQLRPIEIIPNINKFAEGSCLIRCGNTHVPVSYTHLTLPTIRLV